MRPLQNLRNCCSQLSVHFDPAKELVLATNASDYGVGVVLSHNTEGGTEHPRYMSRSLNTDFIIADFNYSMPTNYNYNMY